MKALNQDAFQRARQFLKTQARPLDKALFEFRFEEAPSERVIDELASYQNEDGGFHSLEAEAAVLTEKNKPASALVQKLCG